MSDALADRCTQQTLNSSLKRSKSFSSSTRGQYIDMFLSDHWVYPPSPCCRSPQWASKCPFPLQLDCTMKFDEFYPFMVRDGRGRGWLALVRNDPWWSLSTALSPSLSSFFNITLIQPSVGGSQCSLCEGLGIIDAPLYNLCHSSTRCVTWSTIFHGSLVYFLSFASFLAKHRLQSSWITINFLPHRPGVATPSSSYVGHFGRHLAAASSLCKLSFRTTHVLQLNL